MRKMLLAALLVLPLCAQAEVDFKLDTPAISSIRHSLRSRHEQMEPYLDSGAVGLSNDGLLVLRDAAAVPLAERQTVNSLIAGDNRDLAALYVEIARANGHPEWEAEVRSTFIQRRIVHAHPGWWYQNQDGAWIRK